MSSRKMTLIQQSMFLAELLDRCRMKAPGPHQGHLAGEATLTLRREDMEALDAIRQTLDLFDRFGAADHVKQRLMRRGKRGAA